MKRYIKNNLLSIILLIAVMFSSLFTIINSNKVNATINFDSKYTNVMEDLENDKTFDSSMYTTISNDFSIQVIGIGESSDNELFIYTYQPCGDKYYLYATSINISLNLHNQLDVKNYKLVHLSSSGVFGKYLVNDLEVDSSSSIRYYEIISIFRNFNYSIDNNSSSSQTINEVVYKVGLQYTALTDSNGDVHYGCSAIDTIEITDKFVGFVRYEDNWENYVTAGGAVDRHFVAFSTDRKIDKLYEADVYYASQSVHRVHFNGYSDSKDNYSFGDKEDGYAYLNYTQSSTHTSGTWFNKTSYTWQRIETVDEFIDSVEIEDTYTIGIFNVSTISKINDDSMEELKSKQYVLSFLDTDYKVVRSDVDGITSYYSTKVGEVSILRLKFETDGVVYNLGVVDNKQTGSDTPINTMKTEITINEMLEIILLLILIVIVYIVCSPILTIIFKVIFLVLKLLWTSIKFIFKAIIKILYMILSFPFKTKGGKY